MYLLGFPLLLIPFALYNIVAFIFRLPSDFWTTPAAALPLRSGQVWNLTWEDIFVAGSLLLLWLEIIKSRRSGKRTIAEHILALLVFFAMLAEFVLVASAATSTFFLLVAVSLIDVLAGFVGGTPAATRQVEAEEPVKTPVHDVRLPFPSQ